MPTLTLGIDIGGTKIRAALVTHKRTVVRHSEQPTNAMRGERAIMASLNSCIREVWEDSVTAIGVGLAGHVDYDKGVFVAGPNFPASFRDIPIAKELSSAYKRPVKADNDVHCFTLAEARMGAGKGKRVVVGMTLGTGVGGGIAVQGELLRGKNNTVGELGHMIIAADGPECGCGRKGHLESFASGTAMSSLYAQRAGRLINAKEVERLAKEGDKTANLVVSEMARGLSIGLANIIHIINPDVIVIGGGLSRADILLKPAVAAVDRLLIFPALAKTEVVRSPLGGDANVLGAAIMAETA